MDAWFRKIFLFPDYKAIRVPLLHHIDFLIIWPVLVGPDMVSCIEKRQRSFSLDGMPKREIIGDRDRGGDI
jgi:hypothetical protein